MDGTVSTGPKGWPAVAVAIFATCLLVSIWTVSHPLHHDVAWYIVATGLWQDGARLYLDIVEINPPLAFWQTAAALMLPLPPRFAFGTAVGLAIVASVLWSSRVLRLSGYPRLPAMIAMLLILLGTALPVFGQREQLMLAFGLPYIWAIAMRAPLGRREEILVGAFAFLGFGLKPYFLAVPAAMALHRLIVDRSTRSVITASNLILAASCLTYLVAVWILYPAYFGRIVPAGQLAYFAFGNSVTSTLLAPPLLASLTLALVSIRAPDPRAGIAAAVIGAAIAYVVQLKGWSYHQLPMLGLAGLLATLQISQSRLLAARVLSLAVITLCVIPLLSGPYRPFIPMKQVQDRLRCSRSVLVLGENVWQSFPILLETGARPALAYPALWTLPGAWRVLNDPRRAADHPHASALLSDTRRDIVDALVQRRPDAILVDTRRYKPYFAGNFDYVGFLEQDPRFAEAFGSYRMVGRASFSEVYRRTDRGYELADCLPQGRS